MGNLDKLAKLFADRDNPYTISVTVGDVLSTSPLRVQYGDSIILEARHLIVADSLVKNPLKQGDQVIMIPSSDFNTWFLLDKVGEL